MQNSFYLLSFFNTQIAKKKIFQDYYIWLLHNHMAHIIQKAKIWAVYVTLLLLVPQCFYAWLKILVKCVYLIIFYAHVEETKMGKTE